MVLPIMGAHVLIMEGPAAAQDFSTGNLLSGNLGSSKNLLNESIIDLPKTAAFGLPNSGILSQSQSRRVLEVSKDL